MCHDTKCPYREAARLAAQFAQTGNYATKLCLEAKLRECGHDIPQFSHLYQDKKPCKGSCCGGKKA